MNKQQWIKLCAAGIVTIGLTVYASGLFAGKELVYEIPKIDPRVQDGTYSAQKTNKFSTVRVDMTIENREIKDCTISSSGAGDLMTDDIRTAWANAVVENQDIAPDAITSATLTFSAESVKEAIEDIIAQAVGDKEPEPLEDLVPAQSTETEAETQEAASPTEAPEKTESEKAEPEAPAETDPTTLMRERPVFTEPEAPEAAEAEPEASAETDPAKLMRERPVFTETETPEAAEAETETPAETDPATLMRERPVFTEPEAPEAAEAEPETPAETDPTRLMRERPVF